MYIFELRTLLFESLQKFDDYVNFQKKEAENFTLNTTFFELSRYDQIDTIIRYSQRYRKIMDVDYYTKNPPHEFALKPNYLIGGIGLFMVGIAIDVMGTKEQR